ncbi:MAG: sodium:solute symporter family protein [Planctomycetota bacterium]
MANLHIADISVIALYLLGVTFIGIWSARQIKTSADFFLPHRFGKVMMIMFSFGTGTHSDHAVSVSAKSFTNGLSGIWYQWLWLPVTPFYWLIAPVFRRFRAITTSDIFESRFSPSVGILFAVVGVLNLTFNIGVMLKGSSAIIFASTGGMISAELATAMLTVIFVIYGVIGGLGAAIVTDFIQGILTIIFSVLLLPLVLNAVGGFDAMREKIADPEMFSLVAPGEIGIFYVAVIAFNAIVGVMTQPQALSHCAAGKTEAEGRIGFMGGTLIKRFCTIPWCLTGVAAVVYFAGKDIHPDNVFGTVAGDFLPILMPGVLGIFIAGVLGAVMSSCDAFMIASSALFTENVYRRLICDKDDRHYITVGRIAAMGIVGGGVAFAFWLPDVVTGLEIFWKISPMMGIALWLGLFWRRTTVAGAWAATLGGFVIWFLTTLAPVVWLTGHVPFAREAKLVFVKEGASSVLLHDCHLQDASSLARKLVQGNDPLSAHIYQRLSQETKNLLSQYSGTGAVSDELRGGLVAELNLFISEVQSDIEKEQAGLENEEDTDAFYEESRFAHVNLSDRTEELIARKPEGEALVRLNRRLLEEGYSAEISRSWMFCACDLNRPLALAERINREEDPFSAYVKAHLSDETQRLAESPEADNIDALSVALASDLNRSAGGENIYDERLFAETFASENTIKRAKESLSGEDLVKVNSYLLEEAFIWELSKNRTAEVYLPWQMLFYLTAGTLAGIVVSLLTRPVPEEQLDNFYALVRTPIQPGEKETVPCTLPEGVVVPEKRKLLPFKNLEILVPSRISVIGFIVGWVCVAAIVYAVYLIASG